MNGTAGTSAACQERCSDSRDRTCLLASSPTWMACGDVVAGTGSAALHLPICSHRRCGTLLVQRLTPGDGLGWFHHKMVLRCLDEFRCHGVVTDQPDGGTAQR